jgi:site-specific recombinase XerD
MYQYEIGFALIWRRMFASEMLDAGADIATVQKMMGHANPATTARYVPHDLVLRRSFQ